MDTLEETDIGQLLCYMLGHFVNVEGRKVTFNENNVLWYICMC